MVRVRGNRKMWTRHAVFEAFSVRGKREHWLGFRKTNGWSSRKEPLMQGDIANILYILVRNEMYMAWLYPYGSHYYA